jgi:ornithine cyclodeaminase
VRDINEIRVVARSAEKGHAFIERVRAEDVETAAKMHVAANTADALRGAHVVCAATAATTALFDDADVAAGTHINAVGAYTPAMLEVPAATVARSLIIVDQRAAAWAEAGDLVIARDQGLITADDVHAELGDLVAGTKTGRQSPEQITFFKSVGNAVQDIAVGRRAVDRAMARGLGQTVNLA